jgi:hypothetical protein
VRDAVHVQLRSEDLALRAHELRLLPKRRGPSAYVLRVAEEPGAPTLEFYVWSERVIVPVLLCGGAHLTESLF